MSAASFNKQTLTVGVLSLIGIGLLAVIFYTSIWWVSLTAPNYPEESFPDGVRIEFHINGVFNGCTLQKKAEIQEEEALDCVHEMDTINHYVGMYPIAAGGPLERGFGQFLVVFMMVMLVGFICTKPKIRMLLMTVGFAIIAVWMYLTMFSDDGFHLQSEGLVEALVTSLDQDASDTSTIDEPEIVIGGIASVLKKSLEDSGVEVILPSEVERQKSGHVRISGKENMIEQLKITYDIDQAKPGSTYDVWNGSSFQVMSWHYAKSLARYFNNPEEINYLQLMKNILKNGIIKNDFLIDFNIKSEKQLNKLLKQIQRDHNQKWPSAKLGWKTPCEYAGWIEKLPLRQRPVMKIKEVDQKKNGFSKE